MAEQWKTASPKKKEKYFKKYLALPAKRSYLARIAPAFADSERENNMAKSKKEKSMAEQHKNTPAASPEIAQINTTATAIRETYLDPLAKKLGKTFHAGETLKMAFIALAADAVGLTGESRKKFFLLLDSTPGWFGNGNNSACRQAYERKTALGDIAKDYSDF